MFCSRCGNKLPPESQFCNRCGNRLQAESRSRRPYSIPPPKARPARRRLIVEDQYTEESYYEEPYDEDEYDQSADLVENAELETEEEETIFLIYPAFYGIAAQYSIAILFSIAVTAAIAYFNLHSGSRWPLLVFVLSASLQPYSTQSHGLQVNDGQG